MYLIAFLLPALLLPVAAKPNGFEGSKAHHLLSSKSRPGATIEYQKTTICETTPGVRSYSGYVHLPSNITQDVQGDVPFNISTFFWYFEARHEPEKAPLAIYLAGGPGQSSMFSALGENGPCYANKDSNSTRLNPWSFNTHVNMLYIDQPNQVGYSYDEIVEGSYSVLDGSIVPGNLPRNETTIPGFFPNQNPATTANTSALAARALWHFAQVWFSDFPEYSTCEKSISMWGNSYAGYYTTGALAYFQEQNGKILNGTLDYKHNKILPLHTLGITDGSIDLLYQGPSYATLPYNNTFGIEFFNKTVSESAATNFTKPGGCSDQILECRAAGKEGDPHNLGANTTVNDLCAQALVSCDDSGLAAFIALSGRSTQDISSPLVIATPPNYPCAFLNQQWVQDALGAPVNFTAESNVPESTFLGTGDPVRHLGLQELNYLLSTGVNVALVYGDLDIICNWLGAENLSLHTEYPHASAFRASGYELIETNASYTGGVVRQYEGFSFSRVFDGSHTVSYSQPETVYQIFNRAMFHRNIASGLMNASAGSNYQSKGPASTWGWKNKLPAPSPPQCNVYAAAVSCTNSQLEALANGTAVVQDWIVVEPAGV